ncbi:MAG TPA: hypothetical protein VGB96_15035, partial [Archangium sp.]
GGGFEFEVMGVQSAKDGSVSLSDWDGHRLTYSASRNGERMANWKVPHVKHLSGLFVHEEEKTRFRVVVEADCFE